MGREIRRSMKQKCLKHLVGKDVRQALGHKETRSFVPKSLSNISQNYTVDPIKYIAKKTFASCVFLV